MRKLAVLVVLMIMFISSPAVQGMNKDELQYIGDFLLENNVSVNEWNAVIKENIPSDEIEIYIGKFEDSHFAPGSEGESVMKYQLVEEYHPGNIHVSLTLLVPRDDSLQAEVIAVVEGKEWNKEIETTYLQVKRTLTKEFFKDNYQYFACLAAEDDGIIKPDVFLEKLTHRFNLQHKMTQFDLLQNSTHKKIVYGYTDLWSSKITADGIPVNMQIAVKATETLTQQYTIGTPILISEY